MKALKKVLNWLRKYAIWIAVLQALIWPLSMSYNHLINRNYEKVTREDLVVLQVLQEWHIANILYGARSRDQCEAIIAKGFKHPLPGFKCDMLNYEWAAIQAQMFFHEVDEYGWELDYILRDLYYKNQYMPPESKKVFGEFEEDTQKWME